MRYNYTGIKRIEDRIFRSVIERVLDITIKDCKNIDLSEIAKAQFVVESLNFEAIIDLLYNHKNIGIVEVIIRNEKSKIFKHIAQSTSDYILNLELLKSFIKNDKLHFDIIDNDEYEDSKCLEVKLFDYNEDIIFSYNNLPDDYLPYLDNNLYNYTGNTSEELIEAILKPYN